MLGRNYHKGNAEQRIRTGGIDAQTLIKSGKCEIDKRSGRASYPVLLLHTDICGVIDVLKTVEQLIGICGYAQIPHILGALNDLAVAYIALAALRILIREDALAGRAIINKGFIAENKSRIEHLAKNPLRPLIITLVGGIHRSRPVERKAYALELLNKMMNILIGHRARVHIVLYRVVLGRQAECIKADRKQNIIALHAALAADHLKSRICLDMSDVHSRARGVRKLDKPVKLRL